MCRRGITANMLYFLTLNLKQHSRYFWPIIRVEFTEGGKKRISTFLFFYFMASKQNCQHWSNNNATYLFLIIFAQKVESVSSAFSILIKEQASWIYINTLHAYALQRAWIQSMNQNVPIYYENVCLQNERCY